MILYMLDSTRGSPDGHDVIRYMQGKHYEVPGALGVKFLRNGVAIKCPEEDLYHNNPAARIELSSNVILNTLPCPSMSGFNAGGEARRAVGEIDIANMD